jgi:hypothetical protein
MLKYIRLYEDYSHDIKTQTSETGHTWSEIRDAVQTRIPFTVIVFKNKDSYTEALDSFFTEYDYIKQTAFLSHDGKLIDYPSIFIILDDDIKFKDKIPQIFEKFKIKTLILGKQGEEYSDYYFDDGSSSTLGNEVVSSNDITDMQNDEHFKIGSTYYKFIDFSD